MKYGRTAAKSNTKVKRKYLDWKENGRIDDEGKRTQSVRIDGEIFQ